MLPSSGYFQNVHCPFYKSGLCERPHCHFKHIKSGDPLSAWASEDGFDDSLKTDRFDLISNPPLLATGSRTELPSGPILGATSSSILKRVQVTQEKTSGIPEYRPTPISQLKYLSDVKPWNKYSHYEASSVPRKRKKHEEYVPEDVKYSKKHVCFDLPESSVDEDSILTEPSIDDEEDTNVESGAQFSDEEDYDAIEFRPVPDVKTMDKPNKSTKVGQSVSEFSLVDKIITDVTKNEELIRNFKICSKVPPKTSKSKKSSSTAATSVNRTKIIHDDFNEMEQIPTFQKTFFEEKKSNSVDEKIVSKDKKSESKEKKIDEESKKVREKDTERKCKDTSDPKGSKKSSKSSSDLKKSSSTEKLKSEHSKEDSKKHKGSSKSSEIHKTSKAKTESKDSHKSKSHSSSSSSKDVSKQKVSTKDTKRSDKHEKSTKKESDKPKSSSHKDSNSKSSKSDKDHSSRSKLTSSSNKSISKTEESRKLQDEQITSSISSKKNSSAVATPPDRNKNSSKLPQSGVDAKVESDDEDDALHSDGAFDDDSSGMDSDTEEECRRIFNESNVAKDTDGQKAPSEPAEEKEVVTEDFVGGQSKKRTAHNPEYHRNTKSTPSINKTKLNASQIMYNRFVTIQNEHSQKPSTSPFVIALNRNPDAPKMRIATPNSGLIAAVAEKNKIAAATGSSSSSDYLPTVPIIIKGLKRTAHIPTAALSPRPMIPATCGSKVPTVIRQKYLNNFIDECLKFCATEKEAYDHALEEEKMAYERSTNKNIYLSVAANAIFRLRQKPRAGERNVSSTTNVLQKKTVSHETILVGKQGQKQSFSIQKRKRKVQELVLRGLPLYNCLQEYILTEEQLVQNGFPLAHPTEPGRAVITDAYNRNKLPKLKNPFSRICSRCSKQYYVDKNGDYIREEECDFHWGRIFKQRIAGSIESRYSCCQSDAESDGCCVGTGHVFEGSDAHLLSGFVETLPKTQADKYYGIYALDCEMCYTTAGTELTRVTVVNPDLGAVYETMVKPEHKVLDYNTRFSGITEEDLIGVATTLRDVQAVLLCLVNEQTILIGHSLESDFKALKLIHKTVIDTSVLFPHRLGFPYKRALRTLMTEKCNKIIQNSIGGHDSHEDAVACMELVFCKIKEDSKYST